MGINGKVDHVILYWNEFQGTAIRIWANCIGHRNSVDKGPSVLIQPLALCIKYININHAFRPMWCVPRLVTPHTRLFTSPQQTKTNHLPWEKVNLCSRQPWKAVKLGEPPPSYSVAKENHCNRTKDKFSSQTEVQLKVSKHQKWRPLEN